MPEDEERSSNRSRHAILPVASLTLSTVFFIMGAFLLPHEGGYYNFLGIFDYEYFQVCLFLPVPIILGIIGLQTNNLGTNPAAGRRMAWAGIIFAIIQLLAPLLSGGFYIT